MYTYSALSSVLSVGDVLSALGRNGLSAAIDLQGVIRGGCKCGKKVAVVQTARRPVSRTELVRITNHLASCPCLREAPHGD